MRLNQNKKKNAIIDIKIVAYMIVAGCIIHGKMIFNLLASHDKISYLARLEEIDWTDSFAHGRWFEGLIYNLFLERMSGMMVPTSSGAILSFSFLAVAACLLFNLFGVLPKVQKYVIATMMVALPVIAGTLGYGSGYVSSLGVAICSFAVWVLLGERTEGWNKIKRLFIASLLFSCALGQYQCHFSLYISILLAYLICDAMQFEKGNVECFQKALYALASVVVGLVLYILIMNIINGLFDIQLTSYAGTSTYGIVDLKSYIKRVYLAYHEFFFMDRQARYTMFPFFWRGYRFVFALIYIVMGVVSVFLKRKNAIMLGLLYVIFPLSVNFVFVLFDYNSVHATHMYAWVIAFILIIRVGKIISDSLAGLNIFQKNDSGCLLSKMVYVIALSYVILLTGRYVIYDDVCYQRALVTEQRALAFYSGLWSRITSSEGYEGQRRVCVVKGDEDSLVEPLVDMPMLDVNAEVSTNPYCFDEIYVYSFNNYLKVYCGIDADYVPGAVFRDYPDVAAMPSYPCDGCIMFIEDVVIIKF